MLPKKRWDPRIAFLRGRAPGEELAHGAPKGRGWRHLIIVALGVIPPEEQKHKDSRGKQHKHERRVKDTHTCMQVGVHDHLCSCLSKPSPSFPLAFSVRQDPWALKRRSKPMLMARASIASRMQERSRRRRRRRRVQSDETARSTVLSLIRTHTPARLGVRVVPWDALHLSYCRSCVFKTKKRTCDVRNALSHTGRKRETDPTPHWRRHECTGHRQRWAAPPLCCRGGSKRPHGEETRVHALIQ